MTNEQQMLDHARSIVDERATLHGLPDSTSAGAVQRFATACLMDLMHGEQQSKLEAAALGNPLALIQVACERGTEAHGDEFYGVVLGLLPRLRDVMRTAFRRGVHCAVAAMIDDFSSLVQRREQAQAPQQLTEAIRAMALRASRLPFPSEDPGPKGEDPSIPQDPRPGVELLIAVACMAAEETGLPITVEATSDGVRVMGRRPTPLAPSIRAVTWHDILQADVPVISLAVSEVIAELQS